MSHKTLSPTPVFSDAGAQDNAVIVREAQEWIQEVTGKTFGVSFREALEDGVLLCELMKKIVPGSISKINKLKSPIAHLDNIQQFLNACRELGMKESQLFDTMDLQSSQITPKKTGVKRDDKDRKIRSVCVTLYWLGRTVAEMEEYKGPQLDLSAFSALLQATQETRYSDDEESIESPMIASPDHYQLQLDNHVSSPELQQTGPMQNGMGLTFEQEQTADQLLADIQCAVDEMLHDFQSGYPEDAPEVPIKESTGCMGISVHMISRNGGFGFQVVGGADANYQPEVEMVLPGSSAEDAGIKAGDKIVSVNKEDVSQLTHSDLVSIIKRAGSEGSMLIGLMREGQTPAIEHQTNTIPGIDVELLTNDQPIQNNQPPQNKNAVPNDDPLPSDELLPSNEPLQNNEPTHNDELHISDDSEEYVLDAEDASSLRAPPTASYGGQPLSTLVEYQEETMLEQITEMLEKSPPPQDSPQDTPSPPLTPSHSSPIEIIPPPPNPVSDDRESIERDLEEIRLMEMAATTEQQRKLQDEEIDQQQLNIDDEFEELLSFGRDSKSPANNDFELDFELPPPIFESPPPPKPTAEAPKRQTKKGAPPPTKAKPKRPVSSFVQATVLPPEESVQERARSATPRLAAPRSPPSSPAPNPPSPYEPATSETTAVTNSVRKDTISITNNAPSPQPPSHISSDSVDSPSPQPLPVNELQSARTVISNTPSPQPPQVDEVKPSPVTIGTPSSDIHPSYTTPSPVPSPVPVHSFSPEPQQAEPVTIDTYSEPYSKPDSPTTLPLKNDTPNTQAIKETSTFILQTTPKTPNSQPLEVKELGVVTPDDVEIVGNVKIHRVQRTRWTPKGSSTESVSTPEDQNKHLYKQHFTQMWAKGASKDTPPSKQTSPSKQLASPSKQQAVTPTSRQNGFLEPHQNKSATLGPQMRTSPRAAHDSNKRYTQPGNLSNWQLPLGRDHKGMSVSSRVLSPPQQQQQHVPIKKPNWKSQEELRIHKNATTPNGSFEQQWGMNKPARQQSVPAQTKTQSLPRGSNNDWRINRSSTWSRGVGQRPTDGQQSAFAIKPKNPYDLCSRCHKPLGPDTVMSIPNLKAQYHASCFACRVCRAPLVRSPHNTSVLIKGMHPHCKYCGSTDKGVLTTEC